ncbi:plasmid partitioning protein, partial [Agrobacterium rhizogenes]|nr:plasmid partitioning protein [Rhizobium rhizogenes]
KDASFGDDLREAYGIEWIEDLFAPADEDSRYSTNVDAYLGAQQEWMTANLPKKGVIAEVTQWGEAKLPQKASRVYGKPGKGDHTAMYLDRNGRVQTVHYRMPEEKKTAGKGAAAGSGASAGDDGIDAPKPRPDVTQKGHDMIGDLRTDALHEALARAPIEDDTLTALLVLAFAGLNVRVDSGANDTVFGAKRFARHAARLLDTGGKLSFDIDTLRVAARSMLVDVLSCRRGMSNSGIVSRIAGEAVGADGYLPNMGTEDFLLCLSRQALEASCKDTSVLPRQKVRETRAALVEHFKEGHFVHPAALFAPDPRELADLIKQGEIVEEEDIVTTAEATDGLGERADDSAAGEAADLDAPDPEADDGVPNEGETAYGIAAE